MSLHSKMASIMNEVSAIQNDKEIKGSKASYNVSTIQAVLKVLRPLLVKNGLLVFPIESVSSVTGNIARVDARYKIVDSETGDSETLAGSGAGFDSSDKHVGKASTYAFKTMLLKTFCLATTDEDPDNFGSDANVEQERAAMKAKAATAISNIKTNEGVVNYISEVANRGHISPETAAALASKAMSIASDAERAQALTYIASLDR